jgi:hypothetical protein
MRFLYNAILSLIYFVGREQANKTKENIKLSESIWKI